MVMRMKGCKFLSKIAVVSAVVAMLSGCINDTTTDVKVNNIKEQMQMVEKVLSRTVVNQTDSLTMMSRQQSDVDNLMMGRVVFKDGIYTLAIKREDAIFLGVSEEIYDKYQKYVEELNVCSIK